MCPFHVVELQRPGQRVEDLVGDAAGISAFQSGVVLVEMPASSATSSRRSPATRRFPP